MLERALCDFSSGSGTTEEEIKKSESGSVECIPKRKTGRRVMLGEKLNDELNKYVRALLAAGVPIGSSVVISDSRNLHGTSSPLPFFLLPVIVHDPRPPWVKKYQTILAPSQSTEVHGLLQFPFLLLQLL